eukprot:gene11568-12763_t
MVLAVHPSLLYLLGDPEDPVKVWKTLSDQFQKKTWANKLALRRRLNNLRLQDGGSVKEHVKAMTEIFNELAVLGAAIEEQDKVVTLLASLPESYDMLVTALEHNDSGESLGLAAQALAADMNCHKGDLWIVDSGATCHMSNNKELFHDFEELVDPVDIQLGDGKVLNATGIGTVTVFTALPGGTHKKCNLRNVLFVPKLSFNLISVAKATESVYISGIGGEKLNAAKASKETLAPKIWTSEFFCGATRADEPLGLVHTDLSGRITPKSAVGAEYFMTLTDDKTRYVWFNESEFGIQKESHNEAADKLVTIELLCDDNDDVKETGSAEKSVPRQSTRERRQPDRLGEWVTMADGGFRVPATVEEALSSSDAEQWHDAMTKEIDSSMDDGPLIIAVYVADIILAGPTDAKITQVKQSIADRFEVKDMGELKFFLGVEEKLVQACAECSNQQMENEHNISVHGSLYTIYIEKKKSICFLIIFTKQDCSREFLVMSSDRVTSNTVRPFNRESDVVAWLKKVQLVAKLQKITDVATFLSLYLEGEALALYLEMGQMEQSDVEEIEKRLKVAFSDDIFTAYAKLVKYRWSEIVNSRLRVIEEMLAPIYSRKVTLKEWDILKVYVFAVEDLIWQSIVMKLKESSVIGVASQATFQVNVNNRETTTGEECRNIPSYVAAFDGSVVQCKSRSGLEITVGDAVITVDAIITDTIVRGIDIVLGLYAITQLGGITIDKGGIKFGHVQHAVVARAEPEQPVEASKLTDTKNAFIIKDVDFLGKFDGEYWTVEWFWKNRKPPKLENKIGLYNRGLEGEKNDKFEKAVDQWIEEGILIPWNGAVENGILPLMAVEQPTKNKVRPVLDYTELNKAVECHTGDDVLDVCSETTVAHTGQTHYNFRKHK